MEFKSLSHYSIPSHVLMRMFGYLATMTVQGVNGLIMLSSFRGDAMRDTKVLLYYNNQTRFISCWTFVFQIVYAAIALASDVVTFKKDKKHIEHLQRLVTIRDVFFSSIIVPYSLVVSTEFWAIYLYDRNLILPSFMNKIISPLSNHIVHTCVVPTVLFEMALRPRKTPKSHKWNLFVLTLVTLVYLCVLLYSYYEGGKWPYPILTYLQGTIYFKIFVIGTLLSLPAWYYMQWCITKIIWREDCLEKEKNTL